ncbi:MAG: domain S-box [Verrucomicrobia bacterium]|nr:domain S-box [Verrucomicrobiota bacterium]
MTSRAQLLPDSEGRMHEDKTRFRRRLREATATLALALAVPIVVLVAVVAFLYRSAGWVDHSDRVISEAYQMEKLATTMQNGFRGYRLAGDPRELEPFSAARAAIAPRMRELEALTVDNPSQVRALEELRAQIDACLRVIDGELEGIGTGRREVRDAGFMRLTAPLFRAIQTTLDQMIFREEMLRNVRERNLERLVIAVALLFAFAALAGVPLLASWLRRELRGVTKAYQDALIAAERRAGELQVTLRSIGDAVIATDAEGRVEFINPVAEHLTGWSTSDAKGRLLPEIFDIFDEHAGARAENPAERVLRDRVIAGLANHTVLRARNGTRRTIEDSAAPIRGHAGEIRGVILVFHDVSTKREKERLLEESEERFRVLSAFGDATRPLLDPAEIMIIATRLLGSHLNVTRCGYAEVEPDGEHFHILHDYTNGCPSTVGSYRLSRFGKHAARELRAGRTLVLHDVAVELGAEARLPLAIGMRAIICFPLIKAGALRAMVAVQQSTPRRWLPAELRLLSEFVERLWSTVERARAEQSTKEAAHRAEESARHEAEVAERFRLVAQMVALQVWTANVEGGLEYANQECALYFGTDVQQEILGRTWRRLVHADDQELVATAWRASLATGDRFEMEFRLRRHDGEFRWFLARAQALRDPGGRIVRWFGTNTEIDALKRAQAEAERASRSKDNFIATLSHELRTPLTPVLMTAAALRDDEQLPAETRSQLGMIERNIALEARLIDDLLDMTTITKGKMRLRAQLSDIHALIGLAVEIVRDEANAKEVTIDRRMDAARSGLRVDPARFQQVIWNLLRNAVKFTPRGGRISVETRDVDGADGSPWLAVEICDTGIGINPTEVERIFEPFEQGGRTGDHRFGGLGLGLAIARAIVTLHGGRIRARSEGQNTGAAFLIELPGAVEAPKGQMVRSDSNSPLPETTPAPGAGARREPALRLLLVEDHDATLQVLARLLGGIGHRVTSARSLAEALEAAGKDRFDLVISDLGLPDGTGDELMMKLRELYGLKGVALSGYGMEDDLVRSREAGFVAHLIKPVDFGQLRRVIADAINPRG